MKRRGAHRRGDWPKHSHKRLALGVARHQKAKREKVRTAGGRVGQWWSPTWLAELLVSWAGLRTGVRVLDAGAGKGALGRAAIALGADVLFVERDRRYADLLERELGDSARVMLCDFLTQRFRDLRVDVVLSNPPWEGNFPERFLARAVALAERVFVILPVNVLCGVKRSDFWTRGPVEIVRARALARRPRFLGAKGGMRDVVLLEARLRTRPGPQRFVLEAGDV